VSLARPHARWPAREGTAGMQIGYVVKDAGRWDVEPERWASEFDAGYYGKLLEKAWEEAGFVFLERRKNDRLKLN